MVFWLPERSPAFITQTPTARVNSALIDNKNANVWLAVVLKRNDAGAKPEARGAGEGRGAPDQALSLALNRHPFILVGGIAFFFCIIYFPHLKNCRRSAYPCLHHVANENNMVNDIIWIATRAPSAGNGAWKVPYANYCSRTGRLHLVAEFITRSCDHGETTQKDGLRQQNYFGMMPRSCNLWYWRILSRLPNYGCGWRSIMTVELLLVSADDDTDVK